MDIITDTELSDLYELLTFYDIPHTVNKLTKNKFIVYFIDKQPKHIYNKRNILFDKSNGNPSGRPNGNPSDKPNSNPSDKPNDKPSDKDFIIVSSYAELIALYQNEKENEFHSKGTLDINSITTDIELFYKFKEVNEVTNYIEHYNGIVNFIFEPIKFKEIPTEWQMNIDSCKRFHEVKIYSQSDLEKILYDDSYDDSYDEFIDTYEKLPLWICKLDFLRLILIYDQGGVYSDLDICYFNRIKNFKGLVLTKDTIYGQLNNCFIMCEKKNTIIYEILQEIKSRVKECTKNDNSIDYVLNLTGPKVITNILSKYIPINTSEDKLITTDKITILPKFYTLPDKRFQTRQIFHHSQDGTWLEPEQRGKGYY